jgi:hypothetical protein
MVAVTEVVAGGGMAEKLKTRGKERVALCFSFSLEKRIVLRHGLGKIFPTLFY